MTQEKDNKITHPHLIICEGLDAKKYLIFFLQPLIKEDSRYDVFQVMDAGGNEDFPQFIKALPNLPQFSMVRSVTVIRDSEKNSLGASQSVQTLLKNNGFAIPGKPCEVAYPKGAEYGVKVGYALFPKFNLDNANGTLEDLCLSTLNPAEGKEGKLLEVANMAVTQVGELIRPHKNRLHTYLSLTDKFVGLKVGESATANAFDFSANELEPLKTLLSKMLENENA